MTKKQEVVIFMSLMAFTVLLSLGLTIFLNKTMLKYEKEKRDKINELWIEELNRRGLIIKNDKGGFRWK
jgi:hypothetical protein